MNCSDALQILLRTPQTPHSLKESLGDAYLYARNPIFRAMRDEALRKGFRYELNLNARYFISPVMSLDYILETGTIPYRDNVSAFQEFCRLYPQLPLANLMDGFEPRHAHVLHESTHALGEIRLASKGESQTDIKSVVRALVVEAFAQATDLVANLFAGDDELHYWCLVMNHNWQLDRVQRYELERLIASHGLSRTYYAIVVFMLYANFNRTAVGRAEFSTLLDHCKLQFGESSTDYWAFKGFLDLALGMDPLFRFEASRNYFCSNARELLYLEVIKQNPIQCLTNFGLEAQVREWVGSIAGVCDETNETTPGQQRANTFG